MNRGGGGGGGVMEGVTGLLAPVMTLEVAMSVDSRRIGPDDTFWGGA